MKRSATSRLSLSLALGVFVLSACVNAVPSSSQSPGATLAPGATATAVATVATPTTTLAPGATATPVIETIPPVATPTATATDTLAPTETPTEDPHPNWPAGAIAGKDAGDHIGEALTICGRVAGANWLFDKKGHPTWLNFGEAYPTQRFNAVIWGEQRRQWPLSGKPEVVYPGHVICVTGTIELYQTWPQIQDLQMSDIQVIE